jgi:hypothetical protein
LVISLVILLVAKIKTRSVHLKRGPVHLVSLFEKEKEVVNEVKGKLLRIINPDVLIATVPTSLPNSMIGCYAHISAFNNRSAGKGIVIDDRIISGQRISKIAVVSHNENANLFGEPSDVEHQVEYQSERVVPTEDLDPVSVVDVGTTIEVLEFYINPKVGLQEGQVLWVYIKENIKAYYQVVSAKISDLTLEEKNSILNIKVSAYQLGLWDSEKCRFSPVTWVPPAGTIVHRSRFTSVNASTLPASQSIVGSVPNSNFPIHVNINDLVTHNSAVIGVTGSGKSYLSFYLIEEMVRNNIKVLILDLSRQHFVFLNPQNPVQPLRRADEVLAWMQSDKPIGIHQFAGGTGTYPEITSQFVEKAFSVLSSAQLAPGVNHPAKLCVVFEEAHSLIPEWNQVALPSDTQRVNQTARIILQGRKFGMGSLIISQRTANVTKTILNQCNTIFALQSFDQTGLDFLKNYMGEGYAGTISTLPARDAILVGRSSSSTRPVLFTISDFGDRWSQQPSLPMNDAEPEQ